MAGSTNFQQWNPGAANQETDSQYTSDAMRSGGAGTDAIFSSQLANKLFYQCTIFMAAFAQAMANKGFTMTDTNFPQLVSEMENLITTADQVGNLQQVTYSPSLQFDASVASAFELVLSGNVNASSLINSQPGARVTFVIIQDSVGGHTFAFPPIVAGPGTVDTNPNATSTQSFIKDTFGYLRPIGPMTSS